MHTTPEGRISSLTPPPQRAAPPMSRGAEGWASFGRRTVHRLGEGGPVVRRGGRRIARLHPYEVAREEITDVDAGESDEEAADRRIVGLEHDHREHREEEMNGTDIRPFGRGSPPNVRARPIANK
jgi:hypothetical protein